MSEGNASEPRLAITGLGMVSAVGYSAAECGAAIRAGIARFEELEVLSLFLQEDGLSEDPDNPVTAVGGVVPGIDEEYSCEERCIEMALRAMADAITQAESISNEIALLVAAPLPDTAGKHRVNEASIVEKLVSQLKTDPLITKSFGSGHAATLEALAEARAFIAQGRSRQAIVGAVDSLIDTAFLYQMNRIDRLKHSCSLGGFIPGEASAFCVVEDVADAQARGATPLAEVKGLGLAEEVTSWESDEPCLGLGLAQAIREAAGGKIDTDRIELVVCDMNGEPYRGEEWGAAQSKCVEPSPVNFKLWHPADCIGDVGAASAATNVVAAVRGLISGATDRDEALVFASSESGRRAALIVGRANSERG
jgi:3-oxoacyl-[acyl-carrier-protein] synthase-1